MQLKENLVIPVCDEHCNNWDCTYSTCVDDMIANGAMDDDVCDESMNCARYFYDNGACGDCKFLSCDSETCVDDFVRWDQHFDGQCTPRNAVCRI
eukprot:UN13824